MKKLLKSPIFVSFVWASFFTTLVGVGLFRAIENFDAPFPKIQCASYSLQNALFPEQKTPKNQIENDFKKIKEVTDCVRIYSAIDPAETIIKIAAKNDIEIILGAWLDETSTVKNWKQITNAIKLANKYENVSRVVVGNEILLFERLKKKKLIEYISVVKKNIKKPVSTGENFYMWLRNPDLAKEVDFVGFHIFPYWVRVLNKDAPEFTIKNILELKNEFPKKEIFALEIGWPSVGADNYGSKVGKKYQWDYLSKTITFLNANNIAYNVNEIFDQPWKTYLDGRSDAHFGIFTANRISKYKKNNIISLFIATAITITFTALWRFSFIFQRKKTQKKSILFLNILFAITLFVLFLFLYEIFREYMQKELLFWFILFPLNLVTIIGIFSEIFNVTQILGSDEPKNIQPVAKDSFCPMVSIHLPFSKEPSSIIIQSLKSLLKLKYKGKLEFIIIGNNTAANNAKEVELFLQRNKDDRFTFLHIPKLKGFKAAALNRALDLTDPAAELVGIIDADYQVATDWINDTIRHFEDTHVGSVQYPQDHQAPKNIFQKITNEEYRGFFQIGMVQRNEHNAVIQHGTMSIIRKSVLKKLRWAEWCICEDAELGIRILAEKLKIKYINRSYGKGLLPKSFGAFFRQRVRWSYGAISIIKKHWRLFLGFPKKDQHLRFRQRYEYLVGWIPWILNGGYMIFFISSFLIIKLTLDSFIYFPPKFILYLPLLYVVVSFIGYCVSYYTRVTKKVSNIFYGMIGGLSVIPAISIGVLKGIFGIPHRFITTHQKNIANKFSTLFFFLYVVSGITMVYFSGKIFYQYFPFVSLEIFAWVMTFFLFGVLGLATIFMFIICHKNKEN